MISNRVGAGFETAHPTPLGMRVRTMHALYCLPNLRQNDSTSASSSTQVMSL